MSIAKIPSEVRAKIKRDHEDNNERPSFDVNSKEAMNFVESAPDGKRSKWKLKGRKVIITHSIKPEDLEKLDALADSMGMKRAQLINLLIQRALINQDSLLGNR